MLAPFGTPTGRAPTPKGQKIVMAKSSREQHGQAELLVHGWNLSLDLYGEVS